MAAPPADTFRARRRRPPGLLGNLPLLPGIFPDQMAPVALGGAGRCTLTMMRWSISGLKAFGEHPVLSVCNVASPHWRPRLKLEYRCLVLVTAFSE